MPRRKPARAKTLAAADAVHVTKREAEGAGANAVERQGLDLNRYAIEHILPGAAELCEQGQEREKALQRDAQRGETRLVIMATEVRGMTETVNGVVREKKGWFRTVTPLPHGIRPIMGKSDAELRWCWAQALRAQRVVKTHRDALNMAGPNAITFVLVQGGVELPG